MVGIDARNRDSLIRAVICPICSLLLRDPVQLSNCGHRQCQSCFDAQQGTTIKCVECLEETPRNQVMPDRGIRNDMQKLPIICSFCDWTGAYQNYLIHLDQSHQNPVCDHCGKQCDSVTKLEEHKLLQCRKILVDCALKEYGCADKVVRYDLHKHYQSKQHQETLIQLLFRLGQNVTTAMEADPMMSSQRATTMATTNASATSELQEIYETLGVLGGGVQTLNDDSQRLNVELLRHQNSIQSVAQRFSEVKSSVQEKDSHLEGMAQNQAVLQQDLSSLKQRVEDMQNVSYNGMLTWKISDFQERMGDAQSERQTSIYSPPFYSSPTGYKMRARLYLHGDGNARRTHMSLFFVLMRGEFDAILKFPFNFKVTFCLYDQTPQQRHIIDSFRPDTKSNSFQRPRSEMNIASGIPKFFPLPMIQQDDNPYVRDDTMFIKVMIDFGDMPKTLLPYALSLNPGLPSHVQQAMIRQEAERKSQQQIQQQTPEVSETRNQTSD